MPSSPTQLGYVTKVSVTVDSRLQSYLHPSPLKLTLHALALLVALFIVLGSVWNGFSAFPDEGLYSMQAHQLSEGSWWGPRSAADLDDNGLYNHIVKSQPVGDGQLAYTQMPLYPLILTAGMLLGGPVGLLVISLIGTWVASIGAALIAWHFRPWATLPALWLTGIGSPLLFGANIVLAHSLAAAGIAIFFAGLLRALQICPSRTVPDDDVQLSEPAGSISLAHLLYALPALWFAISVRSEATIVTGAIGAALVLIGLGRRPVAWKWLLTAAGVLVSGAVVYWLNTRWAASISSIDGHGVNPTDVVLADRTGPADAIWTALLRPYIGKPTNFTLVLAISPIAAAVGSLLLRISTWKDWRYLRWSALVVLLLAAVSAVIGAVVHESLISGMFAAFPLLGVSLMWIARRDIDAPDTSLALLTLVIATAGLLMTIYADGGAQQWGGRFFHILVPIVCPLMVIFLARTVISVQRFDRFLVVAVLIVLLISYSFLSLRMNAYRRDVTRDVVADTIDFLDEHWPYPYEFSLDGNHEGTFGDANRPTVIFVRSTYDGFTRMAWQHTEGLEVVTANGKARFPEVLDRVTQAGRDTLVVVSNTSISSFLNTHENDLEILGWTVLEEEQGGITTTSRFLLRRDTASTSLQQDS